MPSSPLRDALVPEAKPQARTATKWKALKDDIADTREEETWEVGMRNNAMEFDAHDLDNNRKLDFREFSQLVRERELAVHSDIVLAYRFQELDPDRTGFIGVKEYLLASLKEALTRSSSRCLDLFAYFDEDGNGEISKEEFRKAIRAFGFEATDLELDAVFEALDFVDHSGTLSYVELNRTLRKTDPLPDDASAREIAISAQMRHPLRRANQEVDDTIDLSGEAHALENAETPEKLLEQLRDLLLRNLSRVMDLFRAWDADKSGTIEKKEFGVALRSLGMQTPRAVIDQLFDYFDFDRSGSLDYAELNKKLRRTIEIDERLRVGAAGAIEVDAQNKFGLGRSKDHLDSNSKTLHGLKLDPLQDLTPQLIGAIHHSRARVLHLFQEWDTNGDGAVSKEEMLKALEHLGLDAGNVARRAVNELFIALDADASGHIDFRELFAGMRANTFVGGRRVSQLGGEQAGATPGAQTAGGFLPRQRCLRKSRGHDGAVWSAHLARFIIPPRQRRAEEDYDSDENSDSGDDGTPRRVLKESSRRAVYKARYTRNPTMPSMLRSASAHGLGAMPPISSMRGSRSMAVLPASEPRDMRRHVQSRTLSGITLNPASNVPIHEQLVAAVQKAKQRVLRVFEEWDADGDGTLSKTELQQALTSLGLDDQRALTGAEELFAAVDADASGAIELNELFRAFRPSQIKGRRDTGRKVEAADDEWDMPAPVQPAAFAAGMELGGDPLRWEPYSDESTGGGRKSMKGLFRGAARAAKFSIPKMALPPIYDQRPQMVRFLRPRAPALQLGDHPSRLRRPRSLANLRLDQLTDNEWYHDAKAGRILPAPKPRTHATFAMTAV